MRSEAVRALVFDVDGVIIDSTVTHTEAWRQYLALHGIELEEIDKRMLGKHNDDIVREFFEQHRPTPEEIAAHGSKKEQLYRDILGPRLNDYIVPGIVDFVRSHSGFPMAVASNAEEANIDFVLQGAGIRDCFQIVIHGNDVERPKPAPDVYLLAAQRLGVRPADCVVFEDSLTGVAAAQAAGMTVVGVATTLREFPGVDLVIDDFRDARLEPWLRHSSLFA